MRVVRENPLDGRRHRRTGAGQPRAWRARSARTARRPNFVSHTTPLTVAAELGADRAGALRLADRRRVAGDRRGGAARPRAGDRARRVLARAVRARALLQRLPRGPAHLARAGRRRRAAHLAAARRRRAPSPPRRRRRDGPPRARRAPLPRGRVRADGRAARAAGDHAARSWARTRGRSAPARWTPRRARRRWCARPARSGTWASPGRPASSPRWSWRCWRPGRCGGATGPPGAARRWPCSWRWRCWCPRRCCRSACATPPSRGSTPTTRPTRSSWAGNCCWTGRTPTARDYRSSGMERFYTRDGSDRPSGCASARCRSSHYAYFPGTAVVGAAWRLVPSPFDDYRVFVLLMTLAGFAAAMAFRAPLSWRLALGVLIAANPIAVRSAWFGQNDAPVDHADGAGVRAGHARALQLGRGVAGGRRAAEAVRRGRDPVPGADDAEAGGRAGRAQALRRRVRGDRGRWCACRS